MSWEKTVFEDLYAVPSRNGLNRPSAVRGVGYKMINMGELFGNDRIFDIPMELVLLNDKEKDTHTVLVGDLLFARQSIVAEGAGKCSIILEVAEHTCFESHIIRVRLNQKKCDPLFYYYLFQSDVGKALLSSIRQQGVQAGIRGSDLSKCKVPLPPLPIQQKIAGILAAYDDLIENNLKRIKLLEEMAQITYEEWFVRLRFPSHESTPINLETGLPEGWSKTKLKAVLSLNYGKALKADTRAEGDIPVYGSSGIVGTHNEALVKGCGIIVGRKGNVGSVFWSHDSFYPIDTVYFVTSKHTLPFLYFALKNSKFNNSDAAVPGLNRDAAYAVEIMLPPEAVEKQFFSMAQKNFKAIQLLEMKIQRLREARDILLPRLMTGVIDVESYDPAQLFKEAA